MPIKDQCGNCKLFKADACSIIECSSQFNGESCQSYSKKSIDLTKKDDVGLSTQIEEQSNQDEMSDRHPQSDKPRDKQGMFQSVFSFSGRIRRTEYCLTYLCYLLYRFSASIMNEDGALLIWWMLFIPVTWAFVAQGVKRCHDLGHSGWWLFIPFYIFWLFFEDGEKRNNRYGVNPKGE